MADEKKSEPWQAQPGPQLTAIQKHWVPEIFFGGAVGGGKSDFMLGDFAQDVPNYGEHWKGIIFRKSYPQLEELVQRALVMYPPWFCLDVKSSWRAGTHTFHWPNGAQLKFRHLENDDAWTEYLGHSYTWIGFDELPQWPTPMAYNQLKTRLRSAHPIPNKRIRATGNPGGVGHGWIKKYFGIDRHPLGGKVIEPDVAGGQKRMFIRSRVTDNKILLDADPGYIDRLKDLGSEVLVKQYLEGDWSVVAGAFFSEFSPNRHILQPFTIPKDWMRYRSMDWGSAKPFSVGWYAVSDGTISGIPRGALVKYREWYGAKEGRDVNVGLKLTAEEVASGLLARQDDLEEMSMAVCDPSAFKEDGGPSIGERMSKICRTYSDSKKVFATHQAADNSRKSGWDMVRARLKGNAGEPPMVFFFSTCEDTIRTLPGLQHDRGARAGMEDIDTDGEDHAADELRYACMSRPWIRKSTELDEPKFANGMIVVPNKVICTTTFNDLMKAAKQRRMAHL